MWEVAGTCVKNKSHEGSGVGRVHKGRRAGVDRGVACVREVRQAVRMVFEHENRCGARWETIRSIAQ